MKVWFWPKGTDALRDTEAFKTILKSSKCKKLVGGLLMAAGAVGAYIFSSGSYEEGTVNEYNYMYARYNRWFQILDGAGKINATDEEIQSALVEADNEIISKLK